MPHSAANAKCVLFGEYSILHGGTALTLPVRQLHLRIDFQPQSRNELVLPVTEISLGAERRFWELIETDFSDVKAQGKYKVESNIPLGAGLGSSAAIAVALHRIHRPGIALPDVIQRAWASEHVFHGKSSGMDPTSVATGKALAFHTPTEFEYLDESLLNDPEHIFVLIDSGVRRSTETGITLLKKLEQENPEMWKEKIKTLQNFALLARSYFEHAQLDKLGITMNAAHEVLRGLELSHPALEKLRNQLLDQALGIKLTGAGRGGFLLALFRRVSWHTLKARQNSSLQSFFELGL